MPGEFGATEAATIWLSSGRKQACLTSAPGKSLRCRRELTGAGAINDIAANPDFRRAVRWAAALNLAYFGVEFAVALAIGSVSLFADSIDFLEDASVNLLILLAIGWSLRQRARLGMALAGILFLPGLATVWMAWHKFMLPVPPAPAPLSITAVGAMLVNAGCALMLARHRAHGGSLARAAYLSARNDVLANAAIILAGIGDRVSLGLRMARPAGRPRHRRHER